MVLLCIGLFLLSSCNSTATTVEPASSKSSVPSETVMLDKQQLNTMKSRIKEFNDETGFLLNTVSEDGYYRTLELYADADKDIQYKNYPNIYFDYTVRSVFENETYHSREIVDQLKKGMLINEVHALIGQPHFNARNTPYAIMYVAPRQNYDFCTVYLLNDGHFLLLRYVPVFIEPYDLNEFRERIAHFDLYMRSPYGVQKGYYSYRLLQLQSIEIVTEAELCKISFNNDYLSTSDEHLPALVNPEKIQLIQEGLTYAEVKELLGTYGMDSHYSAEDDVYYYTWSYLSNNAEIPLQIGFILSDSGEFIVSQIT